MIKFKDILRLFTVANQKRQISEEKKVLEKRAIKGAKKAIKEYRRVFERLAEYDRY